MVLQLTEEEHDVLARFLARGYEEFLDFGDHTLAIRGDGGEIYAEDGGKTIRDPAAPAVIAAALNGLVRSREAARRGAERSRC